MAGLGLRLPTWPGYYYTITELTGEHLTVPDLKMDLADAHAGEDLYFNHEKVFAEANQIRVDRWDYPTSDVVTLAKIPTGVSADDECEFYVAIPAAEVNVAIDEGLASLWYLDTATLTLTAGQNELDVTAQVAWLKNSGQLLDVIYRATLATKKKTQRAAVEFDWDDVVETGAQKLVLYLWDVPTDVTDITLQVRGKHYYDGLSTDASETPCPQPMVVAAAKMRVIKRLPERLKEQFVGKLAAAQQDLAEARLLFLPLGLDKPLKRRTYWSGPEVPCDGTWTW
jgi:hypothetical protein